MRACFERNARHALLWAVVAALIWHPAFATDLKPPKAVIPATYFGLHIHHLASPVPSPWPNMPVPAWRLWDADVRWIDLEPNKGQWRFEKLDDYVSLAQQHRTEILLTLGITPPWAVAVPRFYTNERPRSATPPRDLGDWRTYVATVVQRYKGRIRAYEIWNEPNLRDFWAGTVDDMLSLTEEASQIIHSVDPRALVVSPSATAAYGIPWLTEFLKKGGGQYVDVIGFHFYVDPQTRPPEDMIPVIERVLEIMSQNGVSGKPLWNTETGWMAPAKFESEDAAAGYLARAFILAWAAGLQRFYWYAWDNWGMAIVTYKESEHRVTPAGRAYGVMEQWLVGAEMISCSESLNHVWLCQLNRAGKKEWIVWSPQASYEFEVPGAWAANSVTPLLDSRRPLSRSKITVGPIPVLLTTN